MKFIPFTSYIISEGEKNCPLCGSENYQNISKWDRRFKKLKHVKCETCAFIRQHPLPNNEQLSDYRYLQICNTYGNVQQEWLLIFSKQKWQFLFRHYQFGIFLFYEQMR